MALDLPMFAGVKLQKSQHPLKIFEKTGADNAAGHAIVVILGRFPHYYCFDFLLSTILYNASNVL